MMTNTPVWNKRATVFLNGSFLWVVPEAGYRMGVLDLDAKERLLPPDSSDEEIGVVILDALNDSRSLSLDDFYKFQKKIDELYVDNINILIDRYKLKNKQGLFRGMKRCRVAVKNDEVVISPSRHKKLDSWVREEGDEIEDVIIPSSSSPNQIGAALRVAFSRCVG